MNFYKRIKETLCTTETSIIKLESSALSFLEQLKLDEYKKFEPLFLENFQACASYSNFRDDLHYLINEDYHPKEEVIKRLNSKGDEIQSHQNNATSLNLCLRQIEGFETEMNKKISSVVTFYKKNMQNIICATNDLKYIRSRIAKYSESLLRLKQKVKILQLPSVLKNHEKELIKMIENSESTSTINQKFENIYRQMFELQKTQKSFLDKNKELLPFAMLSNFEEVFSFVFIRFVPRGYRNNTYQADIGRILESFESNSYDLQHFFDGSQKINLSCEEINRFYIHEVQNTEKVYKKKLADIDGNIERLENEIQDCMTEIFSALNEKKEIKSLLENTFEEIDLVSSEKLQQKLFVLSSKDKHFRKEKMKALAKYREKNKELCKN